MRKGADWKAVSWKELVRIKTNPPKMDVMNIRNLGNVQICPPVLQKVKEF